MPLKGTAFEKPGINAAHKSAVREQARLREAAARMTGDAFLQGLASHVEGSGLSDGRKKQAVQEVKVAVEKMKAGIEPLTDLKKPGSCHVCEGSTHGTHLFLCQTRKLRPGKVELPIKEHVESQLKKLWRTMLSEAQKVRHHPLLCSRAHPILARASVCAHAMDILTHLNPLAPIVPLLDIQLISHLLFVSIRAFDVSFSFFGRLQTSKVSNSTRPSS